MMRTSSAFRLPIVPWLVLGAGCADVEPPPASWVGRSATELVERAGRPETSLELPNGRIGLRYATQIRRQWTTMLPFARCEATFVAGPSGIIEHEEIAGEECDYLKKKLAM